MFNIGDIITGTNKSDMVYRVTNSTTKCIVLEIYCNDTILVKVLECEVCKSNIGIKYQVESKYFKLIE